MDRKTSLHRFHGRTTAAHFGWQKESPWKAVLRLSKLIALIAGVFGDAELPIVSWDEWALGLPTVEVL